MEFASMADQCIVCLEDLNVVVPDAIRSDLEGGPAATESATLDADNIKADNGQLVARIKPCLHILHDECLREWAQKANSCPICRQAFNLVEVLTPGSGIVASEYAVEDKKQVADFDPNAWIEDNQEEEDPNPCPICNRSDQEEILLLCDECDAPYHTHCVGLDRVPNGQWFCMECAEDGAYARAADLGRFARRGRPQVAGIQPRTQAGIRRTRQRMRTDQWAGIWGMIGNRVHDAVGLDLDFSDDDQQYMGAYRSHQRVTDQERLDFERWQRRLAIAGRQGAREIFRASAPMPRERRPQTPELSPEESRAWSALEKAKELDSDSTTPRSRKRKSRSVTNSPRETEPNEPERKLKRPRTRRVIDNSGPSSASMINARRTSSNSRIGSPARPQIDTGGEPSFLSSLLREVETAASEDESSRSIFSASTALQGPNRVTSPSLGYSSPGASPSPSSSTYHTPRAMSATPPPINNMKRPGSPLPLSSRIEPNYSPSSPLMDDGHQTGQEHSLGPTLELRQPRPRRQLPLSRSKETSPTRANMPIETKEGINKIVKSALASYWKSAEISKEQYADINRAVSRKLYERFAENILSTDDETCEKIAIAEVAIAVKALAA